MIGDRAIVRDASGQILVRAERVGHHIYYRGASGHVVGYSRLADGGRLNHFAGSHWNPRFVGYDVIEGSEVWHFDRFGTSLGKTLLEQASASTMSAAAIAATTLLAGALGEEEDVHARALANESHRLQAREPTSEQGPVTRTRRAGFLELDVDLWTTVWLDGERLGMTPALGRISLAPGRHRVTLDLPGYALASFEVEIAAGETVPVAFDFEQNGRRASR